MMKVAFMTVVSCLSLSVICGTLAAPALLKMDSDIISANTPLLKLIFKQAFLQQEQEDIEKATKFCLLFTIFFKIHGLDRDCDPKTVHDRSPEHESERAETYKDILDFFKSLNFDPDSYELH